MVYVPYWGAWQGSVWGNAGVRHANPRILRRWLRRARPQCRVDAERLWRNVLTMREILSESVGSRRFQTLLAPSLRAPPCLLACLGILQRHLVQRCPSYTRGLGFELPWARRLRKCRRL
jgi:hypothetical protein